MLNKKILLGITGGIAAYKTAELVRLLRKDGCEVRVVMTEAAQKFITSLTMSALSGNDVYTDIFEQESENDMGHISLSRWADMIIVAPTTASFMARFAHGLCDDLLSTLCIAARKDAPILIAPAMNKEMWQAEVTQKNLNILKQREVLILGPDEGEQACGEYGMGRMLEPIEILESIKKNNISDVLSKRKIEISESLKKNSISSVLSKRKILITAGPTLEPIDSVRYISNFSSGKMGYAIAEALSNVGASVTLITGPANLVPPSNIKLAKVTTATEMLDSVMKEVRQHDMFISVAAVLDYRPASFSNKKIKKDKKSLDLHLELNPDILATVASLPNPPITIGFAAETENIIENAFKKLHAKKVDMIIANQIGQNLGFNKDSNHLFVLFRGTKKVFELKLENKTILAEQLIPFFETLCVAPVT